MKILNKSFSIFIPQKDIAERVKELAKEISQDYLDKDPLFIVILNGAFLFASDLLKEIKGPCRVSFIKVSSYEGTNSTGQIKELIGLTEDLRDQNVILVDDIVDTGITMEKVLELVRTQNPETVAVASLLLKPEAFRKQFQVNYVGFTIPNNFVVGYGLDYDGYGRNLKDIYSINH